MSGPDDITHDEILDALQGIRQLALAVVRHCEETGEQLPARLGRRVRVFEEAMRIVEEHRESTEEDVRAVAWYLQWNAHTAVYTPTGWPGSHHFDGEAFWVHVARAAVSLGARAEMRAVHGPLRSLDGSPGAANS